MSESGEAGKRLPTKEGWKDNGGTRLCVGPPYFRAMAANAEFMPFYWLVALCGGNLKCVGSIDRCFGMSHRD